MANKALDLADVVKALEEEKRYNQLRAYKPYGHPDTFCPDSSHEMGALWEVMSELGWHKWSNKPWQYDFHAAGLHNQERMLMAANRPGKCLTISSQIETPDGVFTVGELYQKGTPFKTWSWDGERLVTASALPVFKKPGMHQCYRLWTERGVIECADDHRVLVDGAYRHVSDLLEGLPCLPGSSLVGALSARAQDALRLSRKLLGFLGDCLGGLRFCGERLRSDPDIAQWSFLRSADVQRHIVFSCSVGGRVGTHTNIGPRAYDPRAILDVGHRVEGQCWQFSGQGVYRFFQRCLAKLRGSCRLERASDLVFRSGLATRLRVLRSSFWGMGAPKSPVLATKGIIAYQPIGRHEVYDFTVPYLENYYACGLIHHNTRCAAAEVAIHMTGRYPKWWTGKRFNKPVNIWTGSPTNETSRDIVQKELLGGTDREALGSGMVPRDTIHGRPKMRQCGVSDVVDQFKVKHVNGGKSTCTLKTFEQGFRKWQGTAPDVVWMDEEPDTSAEQKRIYTEALTRLLTSKGTMMVTFTPLLGVTELVSHFQEGGPGIWLGTATWDDAPHLDPEDRERMALSYPSHEMEARMKGVPMMGEGRVFTVSEDEIIVKPFDIPSWFARIKGLDFGIDHPAAMADLAWDRDVDIIYLVREWRKANAEAEEHAEAINKEDPWIPVSWPHDGSNREKGSGKTLKSYYQQHGVRLISQSARYDKDKGGSQPTEPIIIDLKERISNGGFKVFDSCIYFLEEYRNYHRKDGKLVARKDDVLKATFYALMMKRFAATKAPSRIHMNSPQRAIVSV